jgi:hypothetical protein
MRKTLEIIDDFECRVSNYTCAGSRSKCLLELMAWELQRSARMTNIITQTKSFFIAAVLTLGTSGYALTNSPPHLYPGGIKVALQIESDLYNSLDDKYRNKLQPLPEGAGSWAAREMANVENSDVNGALRQASVSVGFVDFINHIAHAKAIDKIQPGFFDQYMSGLARETENGNLPEAPKIVGDRYWSDEVMNDQSSYFNQMLGMTMAINLSHHYLGDFDKYAHQMLSGRLGTINNFLTPKEWEKVVRAAAVNSLSCALGTEGAKALFGAIGKMPQRPAWTACIVPKNIDIKKLNAQLGNYEVAFFRGRLN